MINTSLFILSVSLFTAMEAEEFIQKVEDYSKKINSFECTVIGNPVFEPLFDSMEKAIEYETQRVKELYGFSEEKITEEKIAKMITNNAQSYTRRHKPKPIYYTCKCLDINNFLIVIYDSGKEQCVQIIYVDNQFKVDYDPRSAYMTLMPRKGIQRYNIQPFFHEYFFNLDQDNATLETKENKRILSFKPERNYLCKYIFENDRLIPSTIIREVMDLGHIKLRVLQKNTTFLTFKDDLIIPQQCTLKHYEIHPTTNKLIMKDSTTFTLDTFIKNNNLKKDDLDLEIPLYTSITVTHKNKSLTVTTGQFGDTPTLLSILNSKSILE